MLEPTGSMILYFAAATDAVTVLLTYIVGFTTFVARCHRCTRMGAIGFRRDGGAEDQRAATGS
jgi:hypothetical protein